MFYYVNQLLLNRLEARLLYTCVYEIANSVKIQERDFPLQQIKIVVIGNFQLSFELTLKKEDLVRLYCLYVCYAITLTFENRNRTFFLKKRKHLWLQLNLKKIYLYIK